MGWSNFLAHPPTSGGYLTRRPSENPMTHSLAADQTSQPRRKSNYSPVRGPSRDSLICKVNADKQNLEPKTLSAIEFCSHGPWFQNPSELLVGPRLALTQKGSLGIDTQRKNICVTNPTCARIGSRISFDMIKSLRTANVVWFPKCKPFKTKNIYSLNRKLKS